jgi:hypothetical protein
MERGREEIGDPPILTMVYFRSSFPSDAIPRTIPSIRFQTCRMRRIRPIRNFNPERQVDRVQKLLKSLKMHFSTNPPAGGKGQHDAGREGWGGPQSAKCVVRFMRTFDDSMVPRALGSLVNDLAATLGESEHYRFIATRLRRESPARCGYKYCDTQRNDLYVVWLLRTPRSPEKPAIVAAQ